MLLEHLHTRPDQKATDIIHRLEQIRNTNSDPKVQRRADFYITELMEDIVDHGGDFVLPEDYLSFITPPPHRGHKLA